MSKRWIAVFMAALSMTLLSCTNPGNGENNDPDQPQDTIPAGPDTTTVVADTLCLGPDYRVVPMHKSLTYAQPMTGLVLWPDQAKRLDAKYNKSISMEYAYCLPCKVVTGKENGFIEYDWTWLNEILNDIASRGHQAIIRFRYEYPNSKDVDGNRGTTAVPDYIKALPDYEETYSANPGGDGPTYYADWSNEELQWFTLQFYSDLADYYRNDSRIALVEVGFGHWAEYHIYGTKLQLGKNFPSHAFQKQFLTHLSDVMDPIPWAISIDAADDTYTPIVSDPELMALRFGLFDDSFMHKEHELGSGDGYNESCWNAIGQGTRWQTGMCGGEISYYTSADQRNFLNPAGMYGVTWEQAAAKYHISFMLANDAPSGPYGTAERFLEASLATGYRFRILDCRTNGDSTYVKITNAGVAPLYRNACLYLGGGIIGIHNLKHLMPGETWTLATKGACKEGDLSIKYGYVTNARGIEFEADID